MLIGVLAVLIAACGEDGGTPAGHGRPDAERPFAPNGVWNRPLAENAPVDPKSRALVASLRSQVDAHVATRYGPTVNTWQYSTPVYTVPRHQKRVPVTLDNRATYAATLRDAIASVPVPRRARPARGNDAHMVVWQPSTDTMWEFWRMHRAEGRWHAKSAGRMRDVSHNPGYFTSRTGYPWGATATSLPLLGGLMRPDELRRGRIDHALALAIPKPRSGTWSFPAQRTDGSSGDPNAIPLGARFRLDPDVDVSTLGLSRPLRAMARAAQRYGIVVRDTAGTVAFYAEDPASIGRNPYGRIFGKRPMYQQLSRFPWDKLELMKLDLRTYRGTGR
jgi:hypothetical protein